MLPEGWKRHALGEIAQVTSGGTPDRSESSYWNGDIPWVTTGEIQFNTITDTVEKITETGLKNSSAKLFPPGTLLMAMYGQGKTRGQVAKLGIEATTNQNSAAILLHDGLAPDFYFHFLSWQYESIRGFGHSGGVSHLNAGLLKQISVPVPPAREQEKIARILATWDEAIVTLAQLLTNSRKQRQALMQQLLSGRRRLPGFHGDWKDHRLGDVLCEVKRRVQWDDDKEYPLISVRRRSGGAFHRETLKGHEILTKKLNTVAAGDFLISKMQVVHGAMAMVPPHLTHMYVSDSYITLRSADEARFDINFFGWLSATPQMYRHAYRSSYGVHIEKMTFDLDMFMNERVGFPPTLAEQQAISSVLEAATHQINNLQQIGDRLKEEKRALMQQLLTGKRRVKLDGLIAEASAA